MVDVVELEIIMLFWSSQLNKRSRFEVCRVSWTRILGKIKLNDIQCRYIPFEVIYWLTLSHLIQVVLARFRQYPVKS